MQKLVSIITPCFNSEKYIEQTIQSVLIQTYEDWELILIDDFSSDETYKIAQKYAAIDQRIRCFQLTKNGGAGIARNYGLSKATGKFIAFLDADDLWKPEKLQKQVTFMDVNNLLFTFSFYETMNEKGQLTGKMITAPKHLKYHQLFFCNFIGNLTAIYDVDFFAKILINTSKKRQDWMLWLTILKQIKTAQPTPESLAYYRIRKASLSSSKIDLLKHNFRVYKNFHQFNIVKSFFCMVGFLFTQLLIKPLYCIRSKQID